MTKSTKEISTPLELKFIPKENSVCTLPYKPLLTSAFYDIPYSGEKITITPFRIEVIELPFSMIIPKGYYVQIVSRSGLAKDGLIVMNAPAVIDYAYTGLVKVILGNFSSTSKIISNTDRIAQMTLVKLEEFNIVTGTKEELMNYENDSQNDRKKKGLGSSDFSTVLNM